MKKILSVIVTLLVLTGCGSNSEDEKLIVGGSTSVLPLMEELLNGYENSGGSEVEAQGGGSGVGIKGVDNETFDIGMVSRELSDSEKKDKKETVIALDGIVVIYNKNNTVKDLTLEQVKDIFTGKITNWKEVGGQDKEIAVISREDGSGTRGAFEEIVGYDASELIKNAEIQKATNAVIASVEGNDNAIGYISLGSYKDSVSTMKINGVQPSIETVKNKTYAISRPFILLSKKDNDKADKLIEFILSSEGQKIVADQKYVTVD